MTLLYGVYAILRWVAAIILAVAHGLRWTGRNFALLLIYFIKYVLPVAVFSVLISPLWWFFWGAALTERDKAHTHDRLVCTIIFSILSMLAVGPLYALGEKQRKGTLDW